MVIFNHKFKEVYLMHKKLVIIMFAISMVLVSCANPNRRPIEENPRETIESSMFREGEPQYCRITADQVDIKAGIGDSFDVIGALNKDDIVKVLREVEDRYIIQLDDNTIGTIDVNSAVPIVREEDTTPPPTTMGDEAPGPRAPRRAEDAPRAIDEEDPQSPMIAEEAPRPTEDEGPQVPMMDEDEGLAQGRENLERNNEPVRQLTAQENQMLQLVNSERRRYDLPPLEVDFEVTKVARIKSQDMADNDYFSHYSPNYGSPFEMMDSFGIKYLQAGENLAGNASIEDAHTALMNSSGHRKNILSPDFTHIGIGIRPSSRYGYLITQMFIGKPQ